MAHKLVHFFIGDQCVYTKNDVELVISDMKSEADCEIRRQKRKRCLAMAKWCFTKSNYHFVLARHGEDAKKNSRKSVLYSKWRNRWLELADKFKEGV